MASKSLAEQVIVVFGASSGIGRATALEARRRGAVVVGVGRDELALRSLAEQCGAEVEVADAASAGAVQMVAEAVEQRHGRIDTWAHVAGVSVIAPFTDMPLEDFRRVIEVDLMGPVFAAKAALPALTRSRGTFVVVSSVMAGRAFPLQSPYSTAKHGVDGFLEALRVEMRDQRTGVTVTQIMPEAVATPFFDHALTRLGVRPTAPPPVVDPERVAERILHAAEHGGRDIVVGRLGALGLVLQRLSPRLLDGASRAVARFMQSTVSTPKSPASEAVHRTPHGDDRVSAPVRTG
jgi:NAD(P)-dependent dehydrogenase (short-subunit alcohol dehydrogenase family)